MEHGTSNIGLETRIRISGSMIIIGLLIELGTLRWAHPTAFLLFLFLGGSLIGLGILLYLYSILTSIPHSKP